MKNINEVNTLIICCHVAWMEFIFILNNIYLKMWNYLKPVKFKKKKLNMIKILWNRQFMRYTATC